METIRAGFVLACVVLAACGTVGGDDPDAAGSEAGQLGTQDNPGQSCEQLRVLVGPVSGPYWVVHPDGVSPPIEVYCEQEINQGGWAMVVNSVYSEAGLTTAFWRISYVERHDRLGVPDADRNYYDGRLYRFGVDYMDVFVDFDGARAIAALVHADGVDEDTMAFVNPNLVAGDAGVFDNHYASGWSSLDADYDPYGGNCAVDYDNVTQHYGACFVYNLGADADQPTLDGGVGPHVLAGLVSNLGLTPEAAGGGYSRVYRIARFTRW